jgi:flagellar assembly protein FliH
VEVTISLSKIIKVRHTPLAFSGLPTVSVEDLHIPVEHARHLPTGVSLAGEEVATSGMEVDKLEVDIQVAEMIRQAEQMAEVILTQAKDKIAEWESEAKEAAYQAGYSSGVEAGRQSLAEAWEKQIQELQQWQEAATQLAVNRVKALGPVLTELTMESIRVILHREMRLEPVEISNLIESLLEFVIEGLRVEIRVHPDDFSVATAAHPKWKLMKFGDWDIAVIPDVQIQPGGCEIRSDLGRVDATLETRLELLELSLAEVMAQNVSVNRIESN